MAVSTKPVFITQASALTNSTPAVELGCLACAQLPVALRCNTASLRICRTECWFLDAASVHLQLASCRSSGFCRTTELTGRSAGSQATKKSLMYISGSLICCLAASYVLWRT